MNYYTYIALDQPGYPAFDTNAMTSLTPWVITLRETLGLTVSFGTAGVIANPGGTDARLVFKATPDGELLAIDATATSAGSGAAHRRLFSLAMDGAEMRSLLGSLLEVSIYAQVEWTVGSEVRLSAPIPVTLRNALARTDDAFPDSAADAAFTKLVSMLDEGDGMTFDVDTGGRKITLNASIEGEFSSDDGWTPLLRNVSDGSRVVQELYDWTGGTGTKPGTGYVSTTGLTATIGDAKDIRGLPGTQGESGPGWAPQVALVEDGARKVLQLVGYIGGEGTPPTVNIGFYVGPSGYTSTIAEAIDLRGPADGDPGEAGPAGDRGWSPYFALLEDGERRVLQLIGYTGGEGDAPTANVNDYLNDSGFTSDISLATDLRGAEGAPGAAGESPEDFQVVLTPSVLYVEPLLDPPVDSPTMRDPARPYPDAMQAFLAGLSLPGSFTIMLGVGDAGSISVTADMPDDRTITIQGRGERVSTFSINAIGVPGTGANGNTDPSPNDLDALGGFRVRLFGDRTAGITSIDTTGGVGGAVTDTGEVGAVQGGGGGDAGSIYLKGFLIGSITAIGGAGGTADGVGSQGGPGGKAAAAIKLIDCEVTGTITDSVGQGGTATGVGSTTGSNGSTTSCVLKTWHTRKSTITTAVTQTHTDVLTSPEVI